MLGDVVPAPEAERIGWINRAVPDAELDTVVADWCTRLLARGPQALRLTEIPLDVEADLALPSVRHGCETLTHNDGTAEFHEGTTAFLEPARPSSAPREHPALRPVRHTMTFTVDAVEVL
jgi:1,4-dihydroxy-2-naphthoyl-CoA synthase